MSQKSRHDEPSNGEQLLLWQLIRLGCQYREENGRWHSLPKDVMPTVKQMNKVIDQEKFTGFEARVEGQRKRVEESARALVLTLESEPVRVALENLRAAKDEKHLEYVAQLAEGLSGSHVGMRYMIKALQVDESPLPVLHPNQLASVPPPAPDALAASRVVVKSAGRIILNVLPALLNLESEEKFREFNRAFLAIFAPADVLDAVGGDDIRVQVDVARDWFSKHAAWFGEIKEATAVAVFVFDAIKVTAAVHKVLADPSAENVAGLAKASTELLSSAGKYGGVIGHTRMLASRQFLNILTRLNAIYDIAMGLGAAYRGLDAFTAGDYSVAVGEGMQFLGLTGGAVAAVYTVAAGAAAVPVLNVVVISGAVLAFAGGLMVSMTRDTGYEQWLQNCWFGTNWAKTPVGASPESPFYRAKRVDETPDMERQVSYWISMIHPVQLTIEKTASANVYTVQCDPFVNGPPLLAYRGSQVAIWRIDRMDTFPESYRAVRIYGPEPVEAVPALGGISIFGPGDDDRLRGWRGTIDMQTVLTDHWIEVQLTMPTARPGDLSAVLSPDMGGINLPLVSTTRAPVERSDNG
ncbi:hypothetical protein ACH9D2_06635 [Kocuria sp. M4R2S49]|uniref:hypothetical protein n=1 Tax=Kocuria rhizosphaericola TaxID=3376284 RepID=UPI00379BE92E